MSALLVGWLAATASTLAWAGFDVLRKHLTARVSVVTLGFWFSALQLPGYVVWALLEGRGIESLAYWRPALLSAVANVGANWLYLMAVRRSPLSVTVPILSLTPVFAAVAAVPLLGERLRAGQVLGVALVAGGALLLNAAHGDWRRPLALARALWSERGSVFMVGVAALWSLTPVLDKQAVRHAGVGAHGAVLALGVAVGFAVLSWLQGRAPELWWRSGERGATAAGGVLSMLALGLQLVAIQALFVSVFEAYKRALGLVVSLVAGRLLFAEPITAPKLVGVGSMALGVALVLGL